MQPQQPNYDFIMNPGTPPPKQGFGSNSMAMRILVVVGGFTLLIIIIGVAFSVLSGGGNKGFNQAAVLSVAQDQTELVRLGTTGVQDGVSQSTKNFAITVKLGMASEQQKLLGYLATAGYSPDPEKELPLKQSAATDEQLTSAKSSSNFDATYKDVMQRQLQAYQSDLKAAYDGANQQTQAVLSANFDASELLLTQLGTGN